MEALSLTDALYIMGFLHRFEDPHYSISNLYLVLKTGIEIFYFDLLFSSFTMAGIVTKGWKNLYASECLMLTWNSHSGGWRRRSRLKGLRS